MAALTFVTPAGGTGLVETVSITNQTANTAVVSKAIRVPATARNCSILISGLTMTGTSPLLDFIVQGVIPVATGSSFSYTDDAAQLYQLGWDGITQKTAATASDTLIQLGVDIATDDTGSATATDAYGVNCILPPVIAYTYTTDGTTDDEDYAFTIHCWFQGR